MNIFKYVSLTPNSRDKATMDGPWCSVASTGTELNRQVVLLLKDLQITQSVNHIGTKARIFISVTIGINKFEIKYARGYLQIRYIT